MDQNLVFVFRGIERVAIVAVAALLVWLGFRLFLALPKQRDSHGKVILPGGISVYLSRVGPGVFFALFGAVVLVYSVVTHASVDASKGQSTYIGTTASPQATPVDISYLEAELVTLNSVGDFVKGVLQTTGGERMDFGTATSMANVLPRIKASVLLRGWRVEWGDPKPFLGWAENAEQSPPPPGISPEVIKLYNLTKGGTP